MKVAIYTISKNEEKFARRFMESAREADLVLVADTGSTDDTVKILREEGAEVHEILVDPWRFDVARNVSLQLVPKDVDICVCIDLDEVLSPGWRAALERSWTPQTTRMRYLYQWSTNSDGTPGITFWYDKIHTRGGYRWVKPVHEVLEYYSGAEVQTYSDGFNLVHKPDSTKSRGSYLPLLELACRESSQDDRSSHYLGREYYFYHMYQEAIIELQRHLSLPSATWKAERAASMRYLAKCYHELACFQDAIYWATRAVAEAPEDREPWVELAQQYYYVSNWNGVRFAATEALKIVERPKSYICDPEAWGYLPHDLLSLGEFYLGNLARSLEEARKAVELDPVSDRLKKNVELIEKVLQGGSS